MGHAKSYVPQVAIFIAGVAAASVAILRPQHHAEDPRALEDLKKSVANLEARIQSRESAHDARLGQIEIQLAAHSAALSDVPSTSQIVKAMEQLLSSAMASLDERLSGQARSIDVLKTTVSQTDGLLQRVLEALDTLQSYSEPAELSDPLLSRPAV